MSGLVFEGGAMTNGNADKQPTFVIVLDKVPGFQLTPELIGEHVAHLRALARAGQLILCGPFTDHPSGMVVITAKDKAEAERIAAADPFVIHGARTFVVRTWLLANEQNNFLEG